MEHMYQEPTNEATSVIRKFNKSDYIHYKASLELPIDGTCVWLLGTPEYVQWRQNQPSTILWISGDPGCGNTTLANFLIDRINRRPSFNDTDYLTIYFFFDLNSEDQSDGASLLSALIHQILQADPALAQTAQEHLCNLDLENLSNIFKAIVSAPKRKFKRLVCIVDALDECETASMTKAISFLASVVSACGNSDRDVEWFKLAVTSHSNRHIEEVFSNLVAYHQIRLADYVEPMKQSVQMFIHDRCIKTLGLKRFPDYMRNAIEQEMIRRSDNTFLWIEGVLGLINTSTSATLESFQSIVRSTPDKLNGLYNIALERSEAREELLRILSIVAASVRPLTLDEINVALAVRTQDTSVRQVRNRCHLDIILTLSTLCGPFIRIRDLETVSISHKTVTKFLLRSADAPRSPTGNGIYQYQGCLDVAEVNQCVAEICAVYLTLDGEAYPTVEENSGQTCRKIGRSAYLFDYAAKYWGTHYRLSHAFSSSSTRSCGNNIIKKAMALCDTSTSTFHDWFQLYWNTISEDPKYPDNITPLMIASHLGLLGLMCELLADGKGQNKQSNHLHIADSEGWTVLHWAAWNGHGVKNDEAISLLLQHHDDRREVSINKKPHANDSYCNEFIEHRKSLPATSSTSVLDIQDKGGRTALHWAADDDQSGVVQLLLEAGAAVDIFDNQGNTPLLRAFKRNFVGPVELLVVHGAEVNLPIEDFNESTQYEW